MEVKVQDNTWCPFCEAEEKGQSENYTGSPEWIERLKEIHDKEHCCSACGQWLPPNRRVKCQNVSINL